MDWDRVLGKTLSVWTVKDFATPPEVFQNSRLNIFPYLLMRLWWFSMIFDDFRWSLMGYMGLYRKILKSRRFRTNIWKTSEFGSEKTSIVLCIVHPELAFRRVWTLYSKSEGFRRESRESRYLPKCRFLTLCESKHWYLCVQLQILTHGLILFVCFIDTA